MVSSINNNPRVYFQYLDVVRFIAAFMIVILHSYEAWRGWYGEVGLLSGGTFKELTTFGGIVNEFIGNLGIGVDIFFLISGFLITYILLQEKKRFGKIDIIKFMIRRTLRIWPLYFFLVALAPFLVSWVDHGSPNYLANALFVGNFETIISKKWAYPFAHFWSICIEEHFYLIWPFIIAFIPKKHLLKVFSVIILSSIAYRLIAFYTFQHSWFPIYLHTLSRIDVLVIGAIGAYFYSEKPFQIKLNTFTRIILLTILIVAFSIEHVDNWNTMFLAGFKKFFYIGLIGVLLLDYNFNPNFKHLLPPKSFLHYLGKVSYGIYMYGNMLIIVVIKKIMWTFQITNMWVYFAIIFTLSLAIPIISYELFEKQILKLNKRFQRIKTDR